jgi:uncharacterized membrane protein
MSPETEKESERLKTVVTVLMWLSVVGICVLLGAIPLSAADPSAAAAVFIVGFIVGMAPAIISLGICQYAIWLINQDMKHTKASK